MRVLVAICCLIATVSLIGCGGSSYLMEYPGGGFPISSMTVEASGVVAPSWLMSEKDWIGTPVGGFATLNSGGAGEISDTGAQDCYFTFDSETSNVIAEDALGIEVVDDFVNCVNQDNCIECVNDTDSFGNCRLNCRSYVISRQELVGEYLDIYFNHRVVFITTEIGMSNGVARLDIDALDASSTQSHLFNLNTASIRPIQAWYDGPSGFVFGDEHPDNEIDLDHINYTIDIIQTQEDLDGASDDESGIDASAYEYGSDCTDTVCIVNAGDIWGAIETTAVRARIRLDALADPSASIAVSAGTIWANAAFWRDAEDSGDISIP